MTENDNRSFETNIAAEARAETRSEVPLSPAQPPASAARDTYGAQAAKADAEVKHKVKWYKRPFLRKLGYALIALIISLTIWGYVLMTENPERTKRVENVRLSIDGGSEASLRMRNLIISEDMTSLLPTVTVNVATNLNDLPRFDSALGEVVTASIDLNDIRVPGVYERRISATSTIGMASSVEPPTVTITVERLVTRRIPVSYSFANSLPDGYWHGEPQLEPSSIDLTGTESKLNSIVKANCIIDLSNRTQSINESFELVLLDEEQNVLDTTGIEGTVPAVTVRMSILPTTEISMQEHLNQAGEINEYYEIVSLTISPPTFSIAAKQEILDSIENSIYLEPVNVTNLTPGTFTQRVRLTGFPNDVTLLSDNLFYVTIVVEDKTVRRTINFPLDEVSIEGIDSELYIYQFANRGFSVTLEGPAFIVSALQESDIALRLDLNGLTRGAHEVTPELIVAGDPPWQYDGSVGITIPRSICTVSDAALGD